MGAEEPSSSSKGNSNLEEILTPIEVHKFGKITANPLKEGYSSIRNPAAFIYKNKIGLLYTVRQLSKNNCFSCLYLAWSKDGENFKLEKKPFIGLDKDAIRATEDPRITKIKDEYWITFTAYKGIESNKNVIRTGLAKTKDFKSYYDRQIILDNKEENKNALLLKNSKYHFIIDRPFTSNLEETPGAQIAQIKNLDRLEIGEFKHFLSPTNNEWENARVGVNTPPIRMKHERYGNCLFMLYHGAQKQSNIYSIGYIFVDEKNPLKILERSKEPLMKPELDLETGKGIYPPEVPNVIFGCGAIPMSKNEIRFYYSGADRYPTFADLKIKNIGIIDEIFNPKT